MEKGKGVPIRTRNQKIHSSDGQKKRRRMRRKTQDKDVDNVHWTQNECTRRKNSREEDANKFAMKKLNEKKKK